MGRRRYDEEFKREAVRLVSNFFGLAVGPPPDDPGRQHEGDDQCPLEGADWCDGQQRGQHEIDIGKPFTERGWVGERQTWEALRDEAAHEAGAATEKKVWRDHGHASMMRRPPRKNPVGRG